MLSLTLKVVWLVFAVLGVPATWFVLIPFASAIGTYWASILYCITVTILEGTFCLGMIWGMTPSNMPHWFCVVQTVIISLCFHVLTGVCGCFTWASYLTVFKPYSSIQASASALLWRKAYYFFVIIFPSLAFTAYLVAVLKTNSVQPMNDMHCDNTSPLWPRLLGYAGAPIVLFTPCFLLSIVTAVRILGLHTRIRALRTQGDNQSPSIRVGNSNFRMDILRQSAVTPVSGLTDKLPTPTLDGQIGMTVDVRLHGSSTRVSSRISLPLTLGTETGSLNIHFQPPALSPLTIPSADPTQSSPSPSPRSLNPPDVDRSQTPSPIIFARVPLPSAEPPSLQLDAAGEPCNNCCASSDHAPGTVVPSHATVSEEPPKCPVSPSRVPASLELGERMPRFHLPTRSPPNGLRPSLELSPDYVRARLEEDRATLAGYLESQHASPRPLHCHPLSTLGTRKGPDIVGPLPSISYTDRALQGLPEVDETDKDSTLKGGEDFLTEREVVSVDLSEPALKPIRQFYRSAPRPCTGRLPGLDPVIWRMVIFQLVFFFILVLASLSTFIDLVRARAAPSPFGTQHIAILLVAWGPAIVFGYLPGVRNPFLPRHCWA